MKKILMLLTVCFALAASSCNNFTTKAISYVQNHCPATTVKNPLTGTLEVHYKCDSLWPTQKIQEKCSKINICIDAANGQISGVVLCPDVVNMIELLNKAKPK